VLLGKQHCLGGGGKLTLGIRNVNPVAKNKFMPSVGFEHTNPAYEQPQTYTLDRAASGIGLLLYFKEYI